MNTKESHPKSAGHLLARLSSLLLLLLLIAGFAQSEPPANSAGGLDSSPNSNLDSDPDADPDSGRALTHFEAELEALRQEILIPGMSAAGLLSMLVASFLLSWLLFQVPSLAWAHNERYWIALRRSALVTAITTVLAIIALLASGQFLSAWWFRDMPLNTPYFLIYTIGGSLLGAMLVYPVQLWLSRRGLTNWPARPLGWPRSKPAGSLESTPALEG